MAGRKATAARRATADFASYGTLPVPTHYVSNSASNGYALGINSGSGASKAAPWLTLEYAISNAPSGSVIQMNNGTYQAATYFNVDGKSLTIQAESKFGVILQAANTQARVIRHASSSSDQTLRIYGVVIDGRSNTTECVGIGTAASTATLTTEIKHCQLKNPAGRFIYATSQKALNLTVSNCSGFGTLSGQYLFDIRSHESGLVEILGFVFGQVAATSTAEKAAIWMNSVSGVSTFRASGVSGSVTSAATGGLHGIKVENVNGAVIERCNLEVSSSVAWAAPIRVCCTNASYNANNAIVRYNTIRNLGYGGYGILIGSDTTTVGNGRHNDAYVHDNRITGNPSATTAIHGAMIGWGSGGTIENNVIDGCGLATIAKHHTGGLFTGNVITRASSEAIRAKGANGATWDGNTITISSGNAGDGCNVNEDGATYSTGVVISNNVYNIDSAPSSIVNVLAGSDASFDSNRYSVNTTLTGTPWRYQGTGYASLAAWKAAIEPTALP